MKKFLTPFFLAALFATLAGCSSNTSNTTTGVKLELTGLARATDGSTQVAWRVVNPNIISYLLAEASHRIYLDGVLIGTVNDRDPVAIPAQAHVDLTSRLTVAGLAAERTLAAAAAAGSGAYRVESTILMRLYGDITDKSSLSAAGKVPVTAK